MPRPHRASIGLLALAAAALILLAVAAGSPAAAPACSQFSAQADAQASFAELGGGADHPVGGLDRDRDGIACEGLPAPYAAYATLGYNRKGGFLYGFASMPASGAGEERFPCLQGNRRGPEGPRKLHVFRVEAGGDQAILEVRGAEAHPDTGRLFWKAQRATLAPGRYYVAFEEAIALTPYGRSECPGFRSREVSLPAPRPGR